MKRVLAKKLNTIIGLAVLANASQVVAQFHKEELVFVDEAPGAAEVSSVSYDYSTWTTAFENPTKSLVAQKALNLIKRAGKDRALYDKFVAIRNSHFAETAYKEHDADRKAYLDRLIHLDFDSKKSEKTSSSIILQDAVSVLSNNMGGKIKEDLPYVDEIKKGLSLSFDLGDLFKSSKDPKPRDNIRYDRIVADIQPNMDQAHYVAALGPGQVITDTELMTAPQANVVWNVGPVTTTTDSYSFQYKGFEQKQSWTSRIAGQVFDTSLDSNIKPGDDFDFSFKKNPAMVFDLGQSSKFYKASYFLPKDQVDSKGRPDNGHFEHNMQLVAYENPIRRYKLTLLETANEDFAPTATTALIDVRDYFLFTRYEHVAKYASNGFGYNVRNLTLVLARGTWLPDPFSTQVDTGRARKKDHYLAGLISKF
jgi:hypothetical protein